MPEPAKELRILALDDLDERQRGALYTLHEQVLALEAAFVAIEATCGGPSRELAVARTKLDECRMWAMRHITK